MFSAKQTPHLGMSFSLLLAYCTFGKTLKVHCGQKNIEGKDKNFKKKLTIFLTEIV